MLARARKDDPAVEWVCADAATFVPAQPADLLFANAVFHWVPDHARLFPSLIERLAPGGVLAVQMPESFDLPTHRLMREVRAALAPGRPVTGAAAPIEDAAFYYDLLAPRARAVDIWRTSYAQVVPDADAIVEWVKGTGLRPYVDDLDADARAAFLSAYRARHRGRLPGAHRRQAPVPVSAPLHRRGPLKRDGRGQEGRVAPLAPGFQGRDHVTDVGGLQQVEVLEGDLHGSPDVVGAGV